ncbi:arabinose transporter [Kerstersia sp.]|uniref:arabinose transporter n=1 Tax=Kerstersia sp. TaxID=1930783 RepID=UPI003F90E2DE
MHKHTTGGTLPPDTVGHQPRSVFIVLLPITIAVFISFFNMGMQLAVLPLHLHDRLGMGPLVVGIVVGAQFVGALLSRPWAGNHADTRGPSRAVVLGFMAASASGVAYLMSMLCVDQPVASTLLVLAGRVILAVGESLIVTGALGWGIALVGPSSAGKVMAWTGMAIFGAYALGAPAGGWVYERYGFTGIGVATILLPLLALACVARMTPAAPSATRRASFYKVLGSVWLPGLGLALCSIGFGVLTAFIALLFAAKGWENPSLAFTAFGVAFIVARIFFGHLPDRIGGARVALVCVVIEMVGQILIWTADSALTAYVGAALSGFGYSLAFPGFGVEAVRRAPPQSRSLAMGAYVACVDISMGITSPLAGLVARNWGISSVYLASSILVGASVVVAFMLLGHRPNKA